ncbi:glycoside hydrolase family 1 protein [Spiroplasma tabanidicola]|uniref:6-phospho-beta-glucosidase n=1 Tax=Spiroplasma tabanidicola TaxID=324079 RepID=A0A6I6CBE7_9MOLU|nr:glycoside hydrolase family 1 protein [Spiroplasma tabanidicola]QGS52275.1 6-phospho-beta-glucosidase [Spiroplasma tabanidicola]
MIKFPKEFIFGVSLSGPQTEGWDGKNKYSVMDYWYKQNKNDFFNCVGPDVTSNFYYDYKEKLKWIDEIGLEIYRTSIQWTRLLDDFETLTINEDGYNFYLNYFKEIKKRNIILVVNLHHFDTPQEILEQGGWENKKTIELFLGFAKKCFELFGDIVDEWTTFNEPLADVDAKYLYAWHYPKISDFKRSIQVFINMIIAHAKVVVYFKEHFKNKKISIILNVTPAYPRSNSKEDLKAAEFKNMLITNSQLDLVLKGIVSKDLIIFLQKNNLMPDVKDEEFAFIKKAKIDYLSLNYYQPSRVKAKESVKEDDELMPESFYDVYDWPEKRINPYRGWEIYPEGIYDIAMLIKNKYDNFPWIISENGMGVEDELRFEKENMIMDDYRIEFIEEHLSYLKKAIDEGANCFGYSLWTFIDCWSWANAYKNRYGIVEYDLNSKKTKIKKSGLYFKNLIDVKKA